MAMKGSMHLYSSSLRELILNEQLIGFASPGGSSSFARLYGDVKANCFDVGEVFQILNHLPYE